MTASLAGKNREDTEKLKNSQEMNIVRPSTLFFVSLPNLF